MDDSLELVMELQKTCFEESMETGKLHFAKLNHNGQLYCSLANWIAAKDIARTHEKGGCGCMNANELVYSDKLELNRHARCDYMWGMKKEKTEE